MSWISDFQDAAAVRDRAAKTLSVQIGLANPLWLAYGAAATAGAAWWMMARAWQPVNLEAEPEAVAALPAPEPVAEAAAPVDVAEPVVDLAAETGPLDPAPQTDVAALPEALPETLTEPLIEAAAEAMDALGPEIVALADDLTRLTGVGPKTAAALAARGVASFADLAAWTAEDLAAFDAEMKLKGRSARDGWLDQARALAAG